MNKTDLAGFRQFLEGWSAHQNIQTPIIHTKIALWMEAQWRAGRTRILVMAFRAAGKSTMVGLFAAWLLYQNPNLRIMVLAADYNLAKKMVRNVKRIIETHPLTAGMKPTKTDQWASDSFTVKRGLELRDPSMLARGVTSNITGSRADIVICDDVEVPNTCDTTGKREELRQRLREVAYVLVAGGAQIYVGTPHHYYSIYADARREDIGEEDVFLPDFTRLKMPLLDKDGNSAWPERYDQQTIARIRRETGVNKFDSQMMLKAVNILDARLNPELLQFYNEEAEYCKELKRMFIGGFRMTRVAAYWDPAVGRKGGDASVLAVVFGDDGGNYYLQHMEYIKVSDQSQETEIDQQCAVVARIALRYQLRYVAFESNGIGGFLFRPLSNFLARVTRNCTAVTINNKSTKSERILNALEGPMAAKRLFVHKSVCQTRFMTELREWKPGRSSGHDDGLDALAGAMLLLPDTGARIYGAQGAGVKSWVKGSEAGKAKTTFEV